MRKFVCKSNKFLFDIRFLYQKKKASKTALYGTVIALCPASFFKHFSNHKKESEVIMKTRISILALLLTISMGLLAHDYIDDVYFKPSDADRPSTSVSIQKQKANYKNGAKEIIYLDDNQNKALVIEKDTVYLLAEMNDGVYYDEEEDYAYEDGEYYLDDYSTNDGDLEYAGRIRRFHNPEFTIHVSTPYTDVYFMDDYNVNIHLGSSYAWANPYWNNYYWNTYSYSSLYWRNSFYYPFSYYSNWHFGYHNPWHYSSWSYSPYYAWGGYYPHYYGFAGYPYYGYGSYYGYNPYYPHYSYPSWSTTTVSRNRNYSENARREFNTAQSRVTNTTRISGGSNVGNAVPQRSSGLSTDGSTRASSVATRTDQSTRSSVRSTTSSRASSDYVRPSSVNTRTRTVGTPTSGRETTSTGSATSTRSGTVNRSTTTTTTTRNTGTTVRTGTGSSNVRRSSTPARTSSSTSRSYTAPSSSSSRSSSYTPSRSTTTTRSSSSYSAPSRSSSGSSSSAPSRSSSGGGRR